MNRHYDTVAGLIGWLREHRAAQPSLEQLAAVAHMSPQHLQRVFTEWAGISPKRFLQVLNRDFLLEKLGSADSLEALAQTAGLSSGSRLHDLFVTLEAMSPGEFRAAGAGLILRYGLHDTPFGRCMLTLSDRGVCDLVFIDALADATDNSAPPESELQRIGKKWPGAVLQRDDAASAQIADSLWAAGEQHPLRLAVTGSNFQIKVWEALLRIPQGQVVSYRQLAEAIGQPTAARAVGNAVGANPVGWLIPCHRVITGSGATGNYRWGPARKAAMLAWESALSPSDRVTAQ